MFSYEYIPELRTEVTVGCDGIVRYLAKSVFALTKEKTVRFFRKKVVTRVYMPVLLRGRLFVFKFS